MKRKNIAATAFCSFLILMASCTPTKTNGDFKPGFEGVYVGELPCADCPGIETYATFASDNDAVITSVYQTEGKPTFTEHGIWKVEDKMLTVCVDGMKMYYVQLSDSVIMMTDSLGNPAEGLEANYQLKKQKLLAAKDFNGMYSMGDLNNPDAYVQTLEITPIDANRVSVEITSQGAGKGCSFKAEGSIVNNQIEVALNQQHPKMQSTMLIRYSKENTLSIYTAQAEDRYDLMYFCGGGGSLAGDYTLVED